MWEIEPDSACVANVAALEELSTFAAGLPGLLAVAIAGRFVLSLLPPGDVGSHAPRDWPLTWAASHVLGALVFGLLGGLALVWSIHPAWLFALGGLAIVARVFTLPAGMVPRHDPPAETPGGVGRFLSIATALVIAWAGVAELRHPTEPGPARTATWIALVILIGYGFERARRAPAGRRCVLLIVACGAYALQATTPADEWLLALFFGAGCAFLIPWLRRADRRALALSALGFAACMPWRAHGWPLVAAGACGLIAWTPGASRATALRWSAATLASVGLLSIGLAWVPVSDPAGSSSGRVLALAALLVGAAGVLAGRARRRNARGVDGPGRELAALLTILALAAVGLLLAADREHGLLPIAPCAVLIVGLSLVRSERPA